MKIALTLLSCLALAPQDAGKGFVSKNIPYEGAEVKYVVYVPPDYDAAKPTPAILFLHGAGETGNDGERQTKVGLGPAIRQNPEAWKFIILFPQAPRRGWMTSEKLLLDMIEKTKKEYNVDATRLYCTGLSMGGMATWALAAKHPEMFAAIAPICGRGDPSTAEKLKSIPIWNFHGDKDTAVPIAGSQQMIDAIKAAGGNPKFTIYPGVGHNSWDKAYREEKLNEWFLQHKRAK